jgi:hypothetical protein
LKLKINKKIIIEEEKNKNKYFLVFFSKRIIKNKVNKNKMKGILLPEIIILVKKIKNINKIEIFKIILLLMLKNIGSKKKEKIENLCKYPPAINSSPKGPEYFLVVGPSKPKISLPNKN